MGEILDGLNYSTILFNILYSTPRWSKESRIWQDALDRIWVAVRYVRLVDAMMLTPNYCRDDNTAAILGSTQSM